MTGTICRAFQPFPFLASLLIVLLSSQFEQRVLSQEKPADEQPAKKSSSEKTQRGIYEAKYLPVEELAKVVQKMYQQEPTLVLMPQTQRNVLLVSAPSDLLNEIHQLLKLLDQPAKEVTIEIWLAQFSPPNKPSGEPKKEGKDSPTLTKENLSGERDAVASKLQKLLSSGQISSLDRFRLKTLHRQSASIQHKQSKPSVVGITRASNGRVLKNLSYQDVGTSITALPRVTKDDVVEIDLSVEDSRTRLSSDGVEVGEEEQGKPILATEIANFVFKSTVRIDNGRAVLFSGVSTGKEAKQSELLIVVSVRVETPMGD